MTKPTQLKPTKSLGKKKKIIIFPCDSKVITLRTHAEDVVGRVFSEALSRNGLRQTTMNLSSDRAPHLSKVVRELGELKTIIEALAVRSVIQERLGHTFDAAGMTVLNADMAYHLLDNPAEPNQALRDLLALR